MGSRYWCVSSRKRAQAAHVSVVTASKYASVRNPWSDQGPIANPMCNPTLLLSFISWKDKGGHSGGVGIGRWPPSHVKLRIRAPETSAPDEIFGRFTCQLQASAFGFAGGRRVRNLSDRKS